MLGSGQQRWLSGHRQRELIGQLSRDIGVSAAAELQGFGRLQLRSKVEQMLPCGGPLLLVLDDVWSTYQLEQFLGRVMRLPPGSQLLLTSRHSDVVAAHNPTPAKLLPDASALALLAWHACSRTVLPGHMAEVATDAVRRCGGLPLAIKVLGGALRGGPITAEAWQVHHDQSHCESSCCR